MAGFDSKHAFKNYPLGFHKQALPAALAALAAAEQGRLWAYHGELFLNQDLLSRLEDITAPGRIDIGTAVFMRCGNFEYCGRGEHDQADE